MKKLKLLFSLFFISLSVYQATAQVEDPTGIVENKKSYWQLSSRIGYDFPMFKEDFKFIEYKGGLMAGLSVNKYWNHWGFEIDFDYIKNSPTTTIGNTAFGYQPGGPVAGSVISFPTETTKTDISRMFIGIGPAYKWQSKNDKLTIELAAMGGLGFINGVKFL